MNKEEEYVFNALQEQLRQQELKSLNTENRLSEVSRINNDNKENIIQYQLNVEEELDRIQHLLSGHLVKYNKDGGSDWIEPDDDRLKIFSEYGVKQLMTILRLYLNKYTLLSNYDEDTIYWKVLDLGTELNDLIFGRYEYFFYYPTPEELFDKYKAKAKELNITENELYLKCVQWSKEELQSKFRHYPIIVLALTDSVHSTYLRALNGEERESLRRQINIHESLNNNPLYNNPQGGKFNPLKPSTWR